MVDSNKLVSVIMGIYNNEETVESAIGSIISQSYKNIELLIIDDKSLDGSLEICRNIQKKYNNIKLYENTENIGLTKSLNKLINYSSGFYIARQDADDISLNKRIEQQVKCLEKFNLDFCSTRARIISSKKLLPKYSHFIPKKLLINLKNPFIHGTLLIRKEVLKMVGGYNEDFYYAQDYRLMKDLINDNYKYKTIKHPLYEINMENNISSNKKEEQAYYARCVKKNIKPIKTK